MSKFIRILIILVAVIALLFISAYIAFNIFGKNLVLKQLSSMVDRPVAIRSLSLRFPLVIKVSGLEIKDFLKSDMSLDVNPFGFLGGKLVLNNVFIKSPTLNLERNEIGVINIPLKMQPGPNKQQLPIVLGLDIRDGQIHYVDNYKNFSGFKVNVYNINVRVKKRGLGLSPAFNFAASASIGDENKQVKNFKTSGWINLAKKDMNGTLEIKDLYTNSILPFYSQLFGNNVSQANMNFDALLKAKNNDLNIKCHMILAGLQHQSQEEAEKPPEEAQKDIKVFSNLFDIFSSPDGKIEVDFVVYTKLDHPGFDRVDFGSSLFKTATKNILSKPPEEVADKVKEIGKDIKAWGKEKGKDILNDGLKDKDIEEIINIFK
jgi:hypothetical protein